MKIPFVDLRRQLNALGEELDIVIKRVVDSGTFIGGEEVSLFEKAFASQYNVPHCIGTGSGTDSLFLILKALGIGPGDEVITPAFSCMPTAEVITMAGAKIVFCDVDPTYYTIDPETVKLLITSRTKAVIAVHLFGQAGKVGELRSLCDQHGIWLVEDCAQAHFTQLDGKPVGTFGVAAAFSFYPTKNLGALGDAGCVITTDDRLSEKIRRLANHGALKRDDHDIEGINSRLDSVQASILRLKLTYLDDYNAKRRKNAEHYNALLRDVEEIVTPMEMSDSEHTYHIYAVRTKKRDQLKIHLAQMGIGTLIHYPLPLPAYGAYRYLETNRDHYPTSFMLAQEVLSLPIYPDLKSDEIDYVVAAIKNFF